MLKALRITSIISVFLAAVFFVFPVFFGVRRDKQAEGFLHSAGAIEEFKKAKGEKSAKGESQTSPLVKQAEAFALYLNPPAKPKRSPASHRPGRAPRPQSVSTKFKLIGTSYYALHPDLSLALIDEPGKGFRWVRQSSEVGHLVIEQIKDGSVVIRDGQKTSELVPERPERRSLLKDTSAGADIGSRGARRVSAKEGRTYASGKADSRITRRRRPQKSAKEDMGSVEEAAMEGEFIPELEAMRISAEEAKRLDRLGKELKDVHQEPNQAKDDITVSDANVSDANLSDANLSDANLSDANVSDVNSPE